MNDTIERIADRIVTTGLARPQQLIGCSDEEVQQVEAVAGGVLPEAYRGFLKRLGRSAGDFMRGTDFLFPEVLTLRRTAEILLEECGQSPLAPGYFVFTSHQGYQFLCFDIAAGEDPPVLLYLEGEPGLREVFPQFSAWFSRCLADEAGE